MKPLSTIDFERVKTMWKHFWAHELYKRPLVINSITDTTKLAGRTIGLWGRAYQYALEKQYDQATSGHRRHS